MSTDLIVLLQLSVGTIFLGSSLGKLRQPGRFLDGVRQYRIVPNRFASIIGCSIIVAEVIIAVSHLSGWLLAFIVPGSLLLLSSFFVAVLLVVRRGDIVECQCFGGSGQQVVSKRTASALALLILSELFLYGLLAAGYRAATLHTLGLGELLAASACTGVTLIFVSWILAAPDVVAARRLCRHLMR